MIYWVGVTANWLPLAHSILGSRAPGWGILMVAAGLITWFTTLIVVVRFLPHRIGPAFFRLVNAALGLILVGFATFCTIIPPFPALNLGAPITCSSPEYHQLRQADGSSSAGHPGGFAAHILASPALYIGG
jgi:hypothetical protein